MNMYIGGVPGSVLKTYFLAQLLRFLLVWVLFLSFPPDVGNILLNNVILSLGSSVSLSSCKGADTQCCHYAFTASQET